ncbi:MAG: cytochrome c-type biogenesis protein [Myxococcota bacterium]
MIQLVLFVGATALLMAPTGDADDLSAADAAEPLVEMSGDRAVELGRKIRCPVCQGMPISESPSKSAQDMMAQLRRLIAEGKSDAEVIAWFKARYGEWAILEPSREGFNLVVWILPAVVLLAGLGLWLRRVSSSGTPSSNVVQSSGSSTTASSLKRPAGRSEESSEDPYLRALRDEVDA